MTGLRMGTLLVVLSGALGGACTEGSGTMDDGGASGDSGVRVVESDAGPIEEPRDASARDAAPATSESCTNGRQDGDEMGVDCGGDCPPCTPGEACAIGADCTSGRCAEGRCASATCHDGLMNGTESGVDCGGGGCAACDAGEGCARDTDCASRLCDAASSTCIAAGCDDGVRNGDETDVDCGGSCIGCLDGVSCDLAVDCLTGYCDASGTCATPTCDDGVRNGDELGVDCGGGDCPGCADGGPCLASSDCTSGVCDSASGTCAAATCTDGVANGDETDVDCGGATCPACTSGAGCASVVDCLSGVCAPGSMTCAAPSCTDGVLNGDETDVDCGGGTCPRCGDGSACTTRTDCESRICPRSSGTCSRATCSDRVRNADETGVDCGGSTCPACDDGVGCAADIDCMSGVCSPAARVCLGPSCSDGVVNGDEIAVDCGGSCPGCGEGSPCSAGADCSSMVCALESCAAPSCTDGVLNGDETDVDCGGPVCRSCSSGKACVVGGDCTSFVCGAGSSTCSVPSCADGVQNGDETDVDCGGSCPACGVGSRCTTSSDCGGAYCAARTCRQYASCNEILRGGAASGNGVYRIDPTPTMTFQVYCDMTTDGGGWTRVARLAAGSHPVSSVYRGRDFFTQAWIQGETTYTTTDNSRVNLWTMLGMLDVRPLLSVSGEMRFSCNDQTRGHVADAMWAPSTEDLMAFLSSELGGAGYAMDRDYVRVSLEGGVSRRVRAFPTSARGAAWGNSHICGSGAGGGAPTAGSGGGFQLGLCHNDPTSSDIDISGAHQVAIGFQPGYPGLRLECTADTPSGGTLVEGTWMAWIR